MKTVDEFQTSCPEIITELNQTPWINRHIRELHKCKQSAFITHKLHRNQVGHDKFCKSKACKHAQKETRKAHIRYIASVCMFRLSKTILVLHQKPKSRHYWNTNPN